MIPLFTIIPLLGAFLISILKRVKKAPDILSNICTFSLSILSIYSIFLVKNSGVIVYKVGSWIPPIGIAMVLDGLTGFMLVTVNIVAFLINIYSISYMEKFTSKWKFYTLFLLMLAGMNGVIITGDMFNLYVFLEIASVASYALVAYGTEHEELEASFKYMVMSSIASSFILLGIVFLYSYTSTLNMADMARVLSQIGYSKTRLFVSVLFLMGFGLKAALVPFHAWLPDAHPSAPAPISAMLSGVFIKVLGLYALCRVLFNVLGIDTILWVLLALGTISIIVGGLLALGQTDFKRLLAYSSISQIGYIVLSFGLGTPLGILAGLFHLFNHAIGKALMFLNSGAVEYTTETRDMNKLGGLSEKMPVTCATYCISSMSIAGIPPFSGFWSKLLIILAAIQSGHIILAIIAVLMSIITLSYYLKAQKEVFFGKLDEKWEKVKEVPFPMKLSMITLAAICLVGGILLLPFISPYLLDQAKDAILAGKEYANIVFNNIK